MDTTREGPVPPTNAAPVDAVGAPLEKVPPTIPAPVTSGGEHQQGRAWLWRLVNYGLLAVLAAVMVADTAPEVNGVAAVAMMLVLLGMKVPIAVCMIAPGALALVFIYEWDTVTTILGELPYEETASWSLSVVPMFIFMGMMLWRSGITTKLFFAMSLVFNRVPASLAVGTNVAGGGLAAVSGSTVGVTYALARIGIPEMLRAGYDKRLTLSAVLMSGLSGQLIPPSVLLVIYAGVASVPVGPQLLAGVVPGVLLVVCQALALILLGVAAPKLLGGREKVRERRMEIAQIPIATKVRAVIACWPVPIIILVVLGGMFSGFLTETEAGALGALLSLILTLWTHRRAAFKEVKIAVVEAAVASSAVFFMLMAAGLMSLVLADSGLATALATWVTDANFSRVGFLLVMFAVYLVLGAVGETLVAMLLTVPILLPLFPVLGIDPLWFGVFAVLCVELGMITPPVGTLSYIVHSIVQDKEVSLGQKITLKDIFTGVGWLLPVSVVVVLILIAFPGLATWLPSSGG
ncbi:TRAP transporter large permease [Pseudonocardia kunmingensis]|nr:TRAP transporter large permease subunit [Pseudonocardia kunmingensis]